MSFLSSPRLNRPPLTFRLCKRVPRLDHGRPNDPYRRILVVWARLRERPCSPMANSNVAQRAAIYEFAAWRLTISASTTVRPWPCGWTMTGLRSISSIWSAWSAAKRDNAAISAARARGRRAARRAPPSRRAAPRSSSSRASASVRAERYGGKGHVAQHFDMDAAEPDHQHRPEIGVAGDAENDLEAGRRHLLHQHALDRRVGWAAAAFAMHPRVGLAHRGLALDPECDRAGFGLVGDVRRLHLERHRAADPRRRGHRVFDGRSHRLGWARHPVSREQRLGAVLGQHRAGGGQARGDGLAGRRRGWLSGAAPQPRLEAA